MESLSEKCELSTFVGDTDKEIKHKTKIEEKTIYLKTENTIIMNKNIFNKSKEENHEDSEKKTLNEKNTKRIGELKINNSEDEEEISINSINKLIKKKTKKKKRKKSSESSESDEKDDTDEEDKKTKKAKKKKYKKEESSSEEENKEKKTKKKKNRKEKIKKDSISCSK